jgi:pimeloyl-ACP methyl ester carboxylesterase
MGDARGDANASPVLFLHGGGQTRHAWGKTADAVAEHGWFAITLDLRGHGDSEWAKNGDYSFTAHCADLISVIDQLSGVPVLVGASLGGIAAILAEGTSDREVSEGLVLVDIAPMANPRGVERIRTFMQSGVAGFETLNDAATAIAAYTPQRRRGINEDGLKKVLRERDGRWYWHWDPRILDNNRTEVLANKFEKLLDAAIGNIDVPTLLLRGALSDVVTNEGVDRLVKMISNLTVVNIDGAAHMIAGDQNNAFTNAIIQFLNRIIKQ